MNDLNGILKRNVDISVKELKRELGVTSNRELFHALCLFLSEQLDHFCYTESVFAHKYWLKVFKYMAYIIEHINHHNEAEFRLHLKDLNKKVSYLIERKDISKTRREIRENRAFLQKIKDNVQVLQEQIQYYASKDHPDLYDYMKYLILKVQNYEYVYETIKNVPEVVNLKRDNDYSLFETILVKCIETISMKDWDTAIYYERILHLFLSTSVFSIPCEVDYIPNIPTHYEQGMYHQKVLNDILEIWRNCKQESDLQFLARIYDVSLQTPSNIPFSPPLFNTDYEDHTKKRIITIDMDGTDIFDDALCLEENENGFVLYMYTPDAASYLSPEDPLFHFGYQRGKNIYLPNKTIYMFPRKFAKQDLSLNKKNTRFAFVQSFYFNHNMTLVSHRLGKAVIEVKEHYEFKSIENALFCNQTEDMLMIRKMYALAKHLQNKDREKRVYHTLKEEVRRLEITMLAKKNRGMRNYQLSKNKTYQLMGHQIVTEFKILANTALAELCRDNHFSFIYRASTLHTDKKQILEMLMSMHQEIDFKKNQNFLLEQWYPYYTTEKTYHSGLEKEVYCHALTPITNMVSLINQMLLNKQFFEGENLSETEKQELEKACTYLDHRIRLNKVFVKEYTKILDMNAK